MGLLSDRFNPWPLGFYSLFATSIATFVLWGLLSPSFASLAVYSIIYGAIAPGWTSLFSQFVKPIARTYLFFSICDWASKLIKSMDRGRSDITQLAYGLPHPYTRHRQHPLYAYLYFTLERVTCGKQPFRSQCR
jgi:hypothetical protein